MKRTLLIITSIGFLVFWGLIPQMNAVDRNLQTLEQHLQSVTVKTKHLSARPSSLSLDPFRVSLEKTLTQNQIRYQITLDQNTLFCRIMTLQVGHLVALLETLTDSSRVMISKLDIVAEDDQYRMDILFSN